MKTEGGGGPEFEPTFDEVMALLSGELVEPRRSKVSDYLRQDPEMLRAALDCLDPEDLESASELEPEVANTAWEKFESEILVSAIEVGSEEAKLGSDSGLQERPAEATPAVEPVTALPTIGGPEISDPKEPPPVPLFRQGERFLHYLAAASFGAVAIALFLFPSQEPAPGSVVLEEIRPQNEKGTSRSSDADLPVIALSLGVDQLALVLVPPSSLTGEIPQVAIYTLETNGTILQADTLFQQDEGTFVLLVAPAKLTSGKFRIRLSDPEGGHLVALYEFKIEARGSPDDENHPMEPENSTPSP